ncbi:MAG: RNase adapter RapZ [Acidimicrobiia bacterium]|nr:RNase adapter RapZ [Acidimicrobiia bacterium]MYC58447.1 RNase adapter RapZ [Acidimicrobiia bacterium]MYI30447.1 RNase adapter RapZ [Acidimicrobiia bacterium]
MAEYVVITGMSGAGRSQAANHFEDKGWYVVDNLPPALLPKVREFADAPNSGICQVGLVLGLNLFHEEVAPALANLKASAAGSVRILFLDASTSVLVKRFESTKRRHPFAGSSLMGLLDAIHAEREALSFLRGEADIVVDTSEDSIYQLNHLLNEVFELKTGPESVTTRVLSFGFKYGIPLDADLVLDCRFLPNPYWEEDLRGLCGKDEKVQDFLLNGQPMTETFLSQTEDLLTTLVPAYAREGKSYLTIAFGCTGGRHRSVFVAEHVHRRLSAATELGSRPFISHRDLER